MASRCRSRRRQEVYDFYFPTEEDLVYANRDAFTLKNAAVPPAVKQGIVARHSLAIEKAARKDKSIRWVENSLPPKALLAASYINQMFFPVMKGHQIIAPREAASLYMLHITHMREGSLMQTNPLGYTALSAMSFAADAVQKQADPVGIMAYACKPYEVHGQTDEIAA